MTDPNEYNLVAPRYRKKLHPVPVKGKVLLYEVSQLGDRDPIRSHALLRTLQTFLKLDIDDMEEMMWFRPGIKHNDTELEAKLNATKIDICADDTLRPLRRVLMAQAVNASRWIRQYFIHGRDVVVSSPDHFVKILEGWERDPCLDRQQRP